MGLNFVQKFEGKQTYKKQLVSWEKAQRQDNKDKDYDKSTCENCKYCGWQMILSCIIHVLMVKNLIVNLPMSKLNVHIIVTKALKRAF